MTQNDLIAYVKNEYKKSTKHKLEDQDELKRNLLYEFSIFPGAKAINLEALTLLSSQTYEQQPCHGKIVFAPFDFNEKLIIINYDSKDRDEYVFDSSIRHIEMIRKLLQPLDDKHALIFHLIDEKYTACGIAKVDNFKSTAAYVITINGHMSWDISYLDNCLFAYRKGEYTNCKDQDNINKMVIKNIMHKTKGLGNLNDTVQEAIKLILSATHGTSFVVFEKDEDAQKEARRLSSKKRGIYVEKSLKELKEDILQIVNVDGGLIFSSTGTFYGFGYLFDGTIPADSKPDMSYEGIGYKGSRHNSMGLYIYCKNAKNISCVGVVVSSDGGCIFFSKKVFSKKEFMLNISD